MNSFSALTEETSDISQGSGEDAVLRGLGKMRVLPSPAKFALNEILWHAVKGKDAPMPPAVRRAIAQRVADTKR